MRYQTSGHFTGVSSSSFDVTTKTPWLYVIACVQDKLIYIGETFDRDGLISRLGSHFGSHNSTLRKVANEHGAVRNLRPPFVVVAAKLPFDEPDIRFDCSSKKNRLLIEALVHDRLVRYATQNEWTVISSTQPPMLRENQDHIDAVDSINECVQATLRFVQGLASSSPFHFVTLGWHQDDELGYDIGRVLNRVEVMLCRYIISSLKEQYGESRWWRKGVPEQSRKSCATRQEEEPLNGETELPKEAYLTLIDLRKIIQSNWQTFESDMQRLSGKSGRERSTRWIQELNDIRRYWAHPIKQIFAPPMNEGIETWIRNLAKELRSITDLKNSDDRDLR